MGLETDPLNARTRPARTDGRIAGTRNLSSGRYADARPDKPQPAPATNASCRLQKRQGQTIILFLRRSPPPRMAQAAQETDIRSWHGQTTAGERRKARPRLSDHRPGGSECPFLTLTASK